MQCSLCDCKLLKTLTSKIYMELKDRDYQYRCIDVASKVYCCGYFLKQIYINVNMKNKSVSIKSKCLMGIELTYKS